MKLARTFLYIILGPVIVCSCIPSGRDYGKEMYEEKCANCHGIEGDGLQQLYPPLKNADYLEQNQDKLACLIRFGTHGGLVVNGVKFEGKMEGQPLLSDVDIHNIINYISKNINPNLKQVTITEVGDQLIDCKE